MLNADDDDADPDADAHAVGIEASHLKTGLTLRMDGCGSESLLERCRWLEAMGSGRSRKSVAWSSAEWRS